MRMCLYHMDSFPSPQLLTCLCLPFITFQLFPCFVNHSNSIYQSSESSPESHRVNLLKLSKVPANGLLNTLSCCWYSKFLMTFHWPQSNRPGLEMESELSQHQKLTNTSVGNVSLHAETQHSISSSHTLLSYNN